MRCERAQQVLGKRFSEQKYNDRDPDMLFGYLFERHYRLAEVAGAANYIHASSTANTCASSGDADIQPLTIHAARRSAKWPRNAGSSNSAAKWSVSLKTTSTTSLYREFRLHT